MTQPARTCILAIALAFVSAPAQGGIVNITNLTQLDPPGVFDDGWAPTADSQRAVFVAIGIGAQEIYSVRFDEPGQTIRLSRNGEMNAGAEIVRVEVSQDSQRVVYLVHFPGLLEDSETLYSVAVDGSTGPISLSSVGLGTSGTGGIAFEVSPTSDRVVYTETTETVEFPFNETSLFSKPITGGPAETLHPASLTISFEISPNGARVVYLVTSFIENTKLFSVPTGGGSGVQLNDDNDVPALVSIGPNSERVVFTAANLQSFTQSLQGAPIEGGGQTILATAAMGNNISLFLINNDTSNPRVVFVESSGQSRLASIPIEGGGEEDLTNGFIDGVISPVRLSPDGQHVVFQVSVVQGEAEFTSQLLSVSVGGLGPGQSPSTFSKGSVQNSVFTFFPSFDSAWLLYGAVAADDMGGDFPGTRELLSAAITGGEAVTLAGPLIGEQRVSFFFPFFDSQEVFYLADQDQDDVQELYTVPIEGGAFTKINNPLPSGGDVTSAFPTPDNSALVFNADQETNDLFDLFLAPLGEPPQVIFSSGFEN